MHLPERSQSGTDVMSSVGGRRQRFSSWLKKTMKQPGKWPRWTPQPEGAPLTGTMASKERLYEVWMLYCTKVRWSPVCVCVHTPTVYVWSPVIQPGKWSNGQCDGISSLAERCLAIYILVKICSGTLLLVVSKINMVFQWFCLYTKVTDGHCFVALFTPCI